MFGKWADQLHHFPAQDPAPGRTKIEKRRDGLFRSQMEVKLANREVRKEKLRPQVRQGRNALNLIRRGHIISRRESVF